MRLLLINPWIHDFAAFNLWARPLGLLRVAERLSACGCDLAMIDCLSVSADGRYHSGRYLKTPLPQPQGLEQIPRRYGRYGITLESFRRQVVAALPADAILMTSIMTYWYPGCQEAIRICRELAPDVPVVLGGLYARFFPAHARRHSGADLVYSGRAEEDGFLQCLRQAGLELTPSGPETPHYRMGFYPGAGFAPLLTSVGCPFHCSYCAARFLQPELKREAPEKTFREIEAQAGQGVTDFAFYDDALLHRSQAFLRPLLERVVRAGLKVRFHTPNGLHARYLDRETAELMAASGFKTIRLSLETVDRRRQAETGGKVANAEFQAAVENLAGAGFTKAEVGVYLMHGLPGQPLDEVREGVRFLQQFPVRIHLTEFSPLPHTEAWNDLTARGVIRPAPVPLLTNNTVFSLLSAGYDAGELKALRERVAWQNSR